jgi:hypothetical protein
MARLACEMNNVPESAKLRRSHRQLLGDLGQCPKYSSVSGWFSMLGQFRILFLSQMLLSKKV